MIKKIIKPTSKQTIAAIKTRDFSEVDKIKESAEKDARQVFNAVASGSVPLIWYDLPLVRCQSGAVSVMRCALHRSTKKGRSFTTFLHGDKRRMYNSNIGPPIQYR